MLQRLYATLMLLLAVSHLRHRSKHGLQRHAGELHTMLTIRPTGQANRIRSQAAPRTVRQNTH
jgi:hypothetical protein